VQCPERPKISLTFRILAWVLVIFFSATMFLLAHGLFTGRSRASLGMGRALLLLLGALIIVPLVFYIAFTGRPPPWWKYLEYATDLERPLGKRTRPRDEP
jgi:hypothetical protein